MRIRPKRKAPPAGATRRTAKPARVSIHGAAYMLDPQTKFGGHVGALVTRINELVWRMVQMNATLDETTGISTTRIPNRYDGAVPTKMKVKNIIGDGGTAPPNLEVVAEGRPTTVKDIHWFTPTDDGKKMLTSLVLDFASGMLWLMRHGEHLPTQYQLSKNAFDPSSVVRHALHRTRPPTTHAEYSAVVRATKIFADMMTKALAAILSQVKVSDESVLQRGDGISVMSYQTKTMTPKVVMEALASVISFNQQWWPIEGGVAVIDKLTQDARRSGRIHPMVAEAAAAASLKAHEVLRSMPPAKVAEMKAKAKANRHVRPPKPKVYAVSNVAAHIGSGGTMATIRPSPRRRRAATATGRPNTRVEEDVLMTQASMLGKRVPTSPGSSPTGQTSKWTRTDGSPTGSAMSAGTQA